MHHLSPRTPVLYGAAPSLTALLLCIALAVGTAGTCRAQETIPAIGNRALSFVASTPEVRFYSDFWLNLHDYLYGRAREPRVVQAPEAATECIAELPEGESGAWREAEAFYNAEMPNRHHRRDPLIRAIRHRLAGTAREHEPLADSTVAILAAAAPAYRSCLWSIHDTRNRERIAELLRVVLVHGPILRYYLEQVYRADWEDGLIVDLAPYAAFANTSGGPGEEPHTMLSNVHPNLIGWSGLEILFHEGSHSMFNSRHGAVARALSAAGAEADVNPPGQLWHAISFHTSGRIVQEMAAAEGDEYIPYYIRRGIYSDLRPVLEAHWDPYLYRNVTMDEAALAVMRALGAKVKE